MMKAKRQRGTYDGGGGRRASLLPSACAKNFARTQDLLVFPCKVCSSLCDCGSKSASQRSDQPGAAASCEQLDGVGPPPVEQPPSQGWGTKKSKLELLASGGSPCSMSSGSNWDVEAVWQDATKPSSCTAFLLFLLTVGLGELQQGVRTPLCLLVVFPVQIFQQRFHGP